MTPFGTTLMKEKIFCSQCKCEFPAWVRNCPVCEIPLTEEILSQPETVEKTISYEALVDTVRKNGLLEIDVTTTEVGRNKKWGFPYQGYGFAWAKRMQGTYSDILVDLKTTEVGMVKKWGFPYLGYGFAWAKRMQGYIGGNEVVLTATKVDMEKKWGFPYAGYGLSWVQEMSGECGNQLKVDVTTTEVGMEKKRGFPYAGYGFAWAKEGILTVKLR
jgi:hypothetical protein